MQLMRQIVTAVSDGTAPRFIVLCGAPCRDAFKKACAEEGLEEDFDDDGVWVSGNTTIIVSRHPQLLLFTEDEDSRAGAKAQVQRSLVLNARLRGLQKVDDATAAAVWGFWESECLLKMSSDFSKWVHARESLSSSSSSSLHLHHLPPHRHRRLRPRLPHLHPP